MRFVTTFFVALIFMTIASSGYAEPKEGDLRIKEVYQHESGHVIISIEEAVVDRYSPVREIKWTNWEGRAGYYFGHPDVFPKDF